MKRGPAREKRDPAWRRILHSLRFRLTLSYVVFFAIILAGIGFLFHRTLSHTLDSHAHDILNEEYAAVKGYLRFEHRQPLWFYDKEDPEEAFYVERLRRVNLLTDPDGHVLEVSNGYLALGVESPEAIRRILSSGKTYWTVRPNSSGVPFLIRAGSLTDGKHQYFFAIGRPLSDEATITREFIVKYVAIIPVLLIIAALMGWIFAGPALKPIIAVSATAQRISGANLALRIDRRGVGDELDHLIGTFNSMMDRLDASFQQSRQFSADVSHELRTPLTVIRGQLEVALFTAQTVEQYREAVVNALQDVERLSHIIKTLLLLAQAEAGHLVLQKTRLNLSNLVAELVEEFQIPAEEAQLELTASLSTDAFLEVDRLQIERLVTNLLSNAIKYTKPGGKVHVTIKPAHSWVELIVTDNGIGIPEDHLPHIFDRFFRVPNSQVRAERGLGLGLSFVAWIVKAHDGEIDVESKEGQGTRFIVKFPVQPAEHAVKEQDILPTHAT